MKIVVYGGPLSAPFDTDTVVTCEDPLTEGTAERLLRDFRDVLVSRMCTAGLLQPENWGDQYELFDKLIEDGATHTCVWERCDYDAQFEHLSPETWDFSDWEECDDPGHMRRSFYLGTVMGLSPSGKVYTPWANSNVELCPVCGGEGLVPNHSHDQGQWLVATGVRHHLTTACVSRWQGFEQWPPWAQQQAKDLDKVLERYKAEITCPMCEGLGSAEAYQDELWREALEEALFVKKGLVLESCEGDPCDLLAVEYREVDEVEEAGA